MSLQVAAVESAGLTVNLIDTPGYPDFIGDLRAGLRAADAAVFVISGADGIDGATALLWQECAAVGMPRIVAVSKLDMPRSDFDETIAICQRVFGDAQPVYLPVHARRQERHRGHGAALPDGRRGRGRRTDRP